ncbi:hypothetical protein DITRI_Ditri12bG0044100 [Diplodiscus trichospermus]
MTMRVFFVLEMNCPTVDGVRPSILTNGRKRTSGYPALLIKRSLEWVTTLDGSFGEDRT